jgi:hypothetical protein
VRRYCRTRGKLAGLDYSDLKRPKSDSPAFTGLDARGQVNVKELDVELQLVEPIQVVKAYFNLRISSARNQSS